MRLERRRTKHLLNVQRQEEDRPKHAGSHQEGRRVSDRESARLKESEIQHGMRGRPLAGHEASEQKDTANQ